MGLAGLLLIILKGLALYEVRLVLRSKRRIRARVSTPASNKTALLNKRTFISKLFTLIEDSIYKRRSTGDTQVALTDTIYEKVRSSFFLSSRHTVRLKAGEREELLSM